jgi:hypothetical protein
LNLEKRASYTPFGWVFRYFACGGLWLTPLLTEEPVMIRKLDFGKYRLYSKEVDPRTGRRRNLGTFSSRAAAEKHERAVQFFKRRG